MSSRIKSWKDESEVLRTSLHRAFLVHCIADVSFALPLMFAPVAFLTLLGWQSVDTVAARLTAAALFGIGIESWLGRGATIEQFAALLNLKIIWSAAAVVGLALSLIEGAHGRPVTLWLVLGVFVVFHILWLRYRLSLNRL